MFTHILRTNLHQKYNFIKMGFLQKKFLYTSNSIFFGLFHLQGKLNCVCNAAFLRAWQQVLYQVVKSNIIINWSPNQMMWMITQKQSQKCLKTCTFQPTLGVLFCTKRRFHLFYLKTTSCSKFILFPAFSTTPALLYGNSRYLQQ